MEHNRKVGKRGEKHSINDIRRKRTVVYLSMKCTSEYEIRKIDDFLCCCSLFRPNHSFITEFTLIFIFSVTCSTVGGISVCAAAMLQLLSVPCQCIHWRTYHRKFFSSFQGIKHRDKQFEYQNMFITLIC